MLFKLGTVEFVIGQINIVLVMFKSIWKTL